MIVSYNLHKPGRLSHSDHTYLMAGLRLVLGIEVRTGNEHSAAHSQPGLLQLLDGPPDERKPRLVRGDDAFGNDSTMTTLETRQQPYLFKLKPTKHTKRYIGRLFPEPNWAPAGQGWERKDGEFALMGWTDKRRVVVLRGEVVLAVEQDGQQVLAFVAADRRAGKSINCYEYAVQVANTDNEVLSLAQLYRDRADAENAFDEQKNEWGWGGFTTHDLHRYQLAARAVALVYNGWGLFVRPANPEARHKPSPAGLD